MYEVCNRGPQDITIRDLVIVDEEGTERTITFNKMGNDPVFCPGQCELVNETRVINICPPSFQWTRAIVVASGPDGKQCESVSTYNIQYSATAKQI